MRILFDQGTPVPLRQSLTHHEVTTAYERDWSTLKNGELLDTAEKQGFEVLVTTDSNLKYQQNLNLGASPLSFFPRRAGHASSALLLRSLAQLTLLPRGVMRKSRSHEKDGYIAGADGPEGPRHL